MERIEEFVDERQNQWCLHCGGWLAALNTNRDHVPTKSILREPLPANLPIVEVCQVCNSSFSGDEEYFVALLSDFQSGTTDPVGQIHLRGRKIAESQQRLRRLIEAGKTETLSLLGDAEIHWQFDESRIQRVILKNARGHAFYEYGEPMLEKPDRIDFRPLIRLTAGQRAQFEDLGDTDGWPEVGSRMLTRVMTGQDIDGGWIVVQDGIYRYSVTQSGGIIVRSIIHEYLATEVVWN